MKRKLTIASLALVLIVVTGALLVMNTAMARQDSQIVEKAQPAESEKIILPIFQHPCVECQQRYNGCYVSRGIQLRCANGALANYVVLSDGNWCYPNAASCGILCLGCDQYLP